jgi:APA family basic amino acid/polyamine antiporter
MMSCAHCNKKNNHPCGPSEAGTRVRPVFAGRLSLTVNTRDDESRSAARLTRAIGPWTLGANAVNLSLGAGIFVLPATVAAILGPAAIVAYLVCAIAIGLVLMCFVELGSRTATSGGAVAYVEDAFGPTAGFVSWVVYSVGYCAVADAAIANVLVDTVATTSPVVASGAGRVVALALVLGGLAAVNVLGVRQGARVAVATTAAKLLPLLVILVGGAFLMHLRELRWVTWPTVTKIGEASLLLFFAFSGAEAAVTPGGEVQDPARTVPRGLLGGTGVLVLLYVSVQIVTQGVLGADIANHAEAPLAAVSEQLLGPSGRSVMVLCIALAIFGTLSADLLASPRAFLPMALDGVLPRRLGAIHPRFRTPHVAIVTYATLIWMLAVSGAFKPLAIMSSVALLVVYLAVCLATLKLRAGRIRVPGTFRTPGGPFVPVVGILIVVWLLAQSSRMEAGAMLATIAAATGYYRLRRLVISLRPERPS